MKQTSNKTFASTVGRKRIEISMKIMELINTLLQWALNIHNSIQASNA
jgi:hypothetical protein